MKKEEQLEPRALGLPGNLSATGLELPENLTFEEWSQIGETLQNIERSVMWWIGDWWAFGEHKYGELSAQASGDDGYSAQTLMDAAWVSRKVEISRRRESLSWSHHREIAALDPDEQTEVLDIAETESLSRNDLRKRVAQRKSPASTDTPVERKACLEISTVFNRESLHLVVTLEDGSTQEHDLSIDGCDLAAAGTITFHRCDWCKAPFPEDGKYCSDSCRWTMANKGRE